jgi:nucleotide-binding universal stress UspA family protein
MKLIIVPTDFSPLADNALKYAMDLATAMEGSLMLLNVYQLPISFSEVPMVTISVDELRKISEEILAKIKQQIERITEGKIKIYTESKLGDVAEEVDALCKILNPFAVVMGTRGVTGAGRFFLGSNSLSVIGKISTPVFIVPPGATFKPIRKVGLATDLRNVVDTVSVSPIKSLVNMFHAEMHVLNVDFERKHFTSYTPEEKLNLDTMLSGLNPTYDFIENMDVDEGINEFATKNNLDLIITLPKKHRFIESLFEKSFTRELIHHTSIPLMCIRKEVAETVA